ncbi:Serine arginine-rich splicing factor 2 [Branchiostoma belcheri]|nr:Serine arginine-rich splicing factor 2 [Branchiostoma belcheri]
MSYGPPPPDIERMYSLKVDNLTYRTTPEDLRRVFEKYGDVGDCYIPRDRFTRESRGFAFVRFYDKRDAEDALDALDGTILDGREVRVQMARYGRPTDPYRRAPPPRSRINMAAVRVVSTSSPLTAGSRHKNPDVTLLAVHIQRIRRSLQSFPFSQQESIALPSQVQPESFSQPLPKQRSSLQAALLLPQPQPQVPLQIPQPKPPPWIPQQVTQQAQPLQVPLQVRNPQVAQPHPSRTTTGGEPRPITLPL